MGGGGAQVHRAVRLVELGTGDRTRVARAVGHEHVPVREDGRRRLHARHLQRRARRERAAGGIEERRRRIIDELVAATSDPHLARRQPDRRRLRQRQGIGTPREGVSVWIVEPGRGHRLRQVNVSDNPAENPDAAVDQRRRGSQAARVGEHGSRGQKLVALRIEELCARTLTPDDEDAIVR